MRPERVAGPRPAGAAAGFAVQNRDRFVDAAYRVLGRHFREVLGNEPGTRAGRDPERLHDMRVATRRMRAGLKVFAKGLPAGRVDSTRAGLKWLAAALGAVRDLDVQIGLLDSGFRASAGIRAEVKQAFRAWLDGQRQRARADMLRVLGSRRYAGFVRSLRRFLQAGPPARPGAPWAARPVVDVVPELIAPRVRLVMLEGRALGAQATAAELHAFRISCKRLRYLCEFFADLYGRPAARMVKRLKAVQNALGEHQDGIVGQELLARFMYRARPRRGGLAVRHPGPAELAAWYVSRTEAARRRFAPAWKRLAAPKLHARLHRELARLRSNAG
jgi:CHAD domain-containing protein